MGNVVFIACTNVGRAMIETVMNYDFGSEIELAGVVNLNPDAAIGKANYDSYIDLYDKYGIRHYYCNNVNEDECVEFIKSCKPDIIIQSGWSQKFSEKVLRLPKYACIGEHPAPLPRGRGAACVNWAIITGEYDWGDSFFRMEMDYDTGVIYSQKHFNIEIYDDVKTVYDKVAYMAVETIKDHLADWVNGRLEGVLQDDTVSTHYPRRKPSDGRFAFEDNDALNIYNFIRGQAKPYPGAFFYFTNGDDVKKVYVWKARLGDIPKDEEVVAFCKDGSGIILQRVQEEGKTEMWARDYFQKKKLVKESGLNEID